MPAPKVLRLVAGQYAEEETVSASAGAPSAYKIPALNADGKLDPSLIAAAGIMPPYLTYDEPLAEGSVITCVSPWLVTTYQWRRDGEAVEGATASTYTLTAADSEAVITCAATGSGLLTAGVTAPLFPSDLTIVFDTTVHGSNKTFSNDNQTFEVTSASSSMQVFTAPSVTGKVYVELKIEALGSGEVDISFGMSVDKTVTNAITNSGSVNLYSARPDDSNPGSSVTPVYDRHWTTYTSWQPGDVLQLAFDDSDQSVMFNLNDFEWTSKYFASSFGRGDWLYITAGAQKVGTRLTINGGASPFSFTPPTGYAGPDA